MVAGLRLVLPILLAHAAAASGLLVFRGDGKLQFSEALALQVNGKDKALILGEKPETPAAIKNLPSVRLTGTLVKDAGSGIVASYGRDLPPRFLYPDGLDKKLVQPAAEAWKDSRITYKKTQADKSPVAVPAEQFVAYLQGGVEELAALCTDAGALKLIGGSGGVFPAQLELTSAAVAAYGSHPAMRVVEHHVAGVMRTRVERFEKGIDSAKSLDEGLQFARLSAEAYPSLAEHDHYRKLLAGNKIWLDRRVAILRALAAGSQWDAFLFSYRDLEKHQSSFPDLAAAQREALKSSLNKHWKAGKDGLGNGQHRRALDELRLAILRHPSDPAVQKDLAIAWSEYSRQSASDLRAKRKSLSAGEREAMSQSLHFAQRYREQKKLDEALKSISDAERIDPQALPVLLAKAEILGARNEIASALSALDIYDMHAVDEERAAGVRLRNELLFELTVGLDESAKQMEAAWKDGRYHETLRLTRKGLLADGKRSKFLYYAGLASLVIRDQQAGVELLKRYLEVSNTLDADPKQRLEVIGLLSLPSLSTPPSGGESNWFSGRKLPPGVAYCPSGLAFQYKIDRIVASNKLTVRYLWEGPRLKSIIPAFEKPEQATGEKPVVFSYDPRVPHAVAVDSGDTPRKAVADPDELMKSANVVLANYPFADLQMIDRLTGRQPALTVTGNRFFNPFVWERPYVFSIEYDEQGRVKTARQVTAAEGPQRPAVMVEFSWDGLKLTSIKAYPLAASGAAAQAAIYERVQRYVQDNLMGEEIRAGGKSSSIKYNWKAGALVSAECGKDETVDSRSRDVSFAASAAVQDR